MSLFKQAYARGVMETLLSQGLIKCASLEEATKIADEVGAAFDVEPVNGRVPSSKVAALAAALIEKAANSSLITGHKAEQENTAANAAKHQAEAALDKAQRPAGYAVKGEKGVGKSDMEAPASAQVGEEKKHPHAPGVTDHKANTVNKVATLSDLVRKIASGGAGSLITGHDATQENTPSNAAQHNAEAALDQSIRPQGEYAKGEKGVGKTELDTAKGSVGHEEKHPKAPGTTGQGSNTAEAQSKTSAYLARFEETANTYLSKLPATLGDNEKVAAIKTLMGLDEEEASSFLVRVAEESKEEKEDRHPALVGAKKEHEDKETKHEEKLEHKDEEKEEKTKKEAAPHNRKYQDPYGYKKYDALAVGPGQNGPQQKTASVLSGLLNLAKK